MSIRRMIRAFLGRTDGAILVFVAISMSIFLGLAALSFDLGRVAATQSDLQSFADNVALAAAGELDGGGDAIDRARAAGANLVTDIQRFGNGGTDLSGDTGDGVTDFALTFHTSLPADDLAAIASLTTVDADALYARVVVNQHAVDTPFAAAFALLTGNTALNASVGAEAVAGFTQYACDVTPLMFCIPGPGYRANDHIGDMILLRSGGSGSGAWQPGNFGFVDLSGAGIDEAGPCDGLNGQNLSRCLLAAEDFLTKCFAQRGINTKPGQNVGTYEAAINVRFDLYEATMNGQKNDADYRPAPSVVKGVVANNPQGCVGNNPVNSPSEPLLRDTCFFSGTCATAGDGPRFGDGVWDRGAYVAANHTDPMTGVPTYPPGTSSASTRYGMYLAEIAQAVGVTAPAEFGEATPTFSGEDYAEYRTALVLGDSAVAILGGTESGRPTCSSHRSPDPERRVVVAAGVNCDPATGGTEITGAEENVPVEEFFRIFLTEPAGTDPVNTQHFDIWGEIIGSAGGPGTGGGTAGIFRDVVQLYR